jgi:DNA-binding LacI/PurR family transcriptional regulator
MATLKEVAKRALVSTATVSKVLSNTPYVSDETRQRVLTAIDELGYVPNLAARALSKGRTYIIGVIFPYNYDHLFGDPLILTMIEGIEAVCTERQYNMLISTPRIPVKESEQYHRLVRSGYLDGVIAFETMPQEPVTTLLTSYGYPWIAIGYRSAMGHSSVIHPDDFIGAKAAAQHIIALGHRHIAIIGVEAASLTAAEQRIAGYRAAFDEAGLPFDKVPQVVGNFSVESGYQAAEALLRLTPRPTALLCLNDRMAMGAMQRARSLNLNVPDDLSVVGFDDIPSALYSNPSLTTVRQPAHEIGVKAAEVIFDLIEGQKQPQRAYYQGFAPVIFPTELIIRQSTAPVLSAQPR